MITASGAILRFHYAWKLCKRVVKKLSKNVKKVLTKEKWSGSINKLSRTSDNELLRKVKKFLTKRNAYDNITKLSTNFKLRRKQNKKVVDKDD